MGKGYVSLSVPKMMAGSLPFLIIFLDINWKMKDFMQYGMTCSLIVAIVMLKDIPFLTAQKKGSSHVCWNCRAIVHIASKCAKGKNKSFKKTRKTLTVPQDSANQDKAQQASYSTNIMSMASLSTVSNAMKRKRSRQNRSGDNPRIQSTSLVATEENSVLMSTQEILAVLFSSNVNSQANNSSLKKGSTFDFRKFTPVDQKIYNISQTVNSRTLNKKPLRVQYPSSYYQQFRLLMPHYVHGGQ